MKDCTSINGIIILTVLILFTAVVALPADAANPYTNAPQISLPQVHPDANTLVGGSPVTPLVSSIYSADGKTHSKINRDDARRLPLTESNIQSLQKIIPAESREQPTGTPPGIEWAKCYGGGSEDSAESIEPTTDGGYIVAGYTNSTDGDVTGKHGGLDYWVLKLNISGTIEWQKCLGGSSDDIAYFIYQTSDGGYVVAGNTESTDGDVTGNHGWVDMWVVKLNSTGTIEWQKCLGGSSIDQTFSIQQTTDGGYIVAGDAHSTDGDVAGNHGGYDFWVVKLTNTGAIEWQKCLGGSDWDFAQSIQQTSDGGYIVAGMCGQTSSYNGDIIGFHQSADGWVVKLSSTGNIEWQKCLGGSAFDVLSSVQQTSDGGYIVAGESYSSDWGVTGNHGNDDFWVVKLTNTGAIEWQKCLGGSGEDRAFSIQQTGEGGYIVTGYTGSNDGDVTGNHGIDNYWVVKLTNSGVIEWQKCLGGSHQDFAQTIQQIGDGGYVVAGWAWSNDGDVTGNHGNGDFWVVKLSGNQPSPAPIANFTATPKSGSAPMTVQYTDTSTGTPISWIWTFGDGSNSTIQHPIHTYSMAGQYTVSLTAGNAGGSSTMSIPDYISVTDNPSATYVINATANDFANIKPSGLITVKGGESIEFTLQAKAGTSISNLTVDSMQVTVPVNNRYSISNITSNHTVHLNAAPASGVVLASFMANTTNGPSPLAVQFTDTSSGGPNQWSWNFGDGQISPQQNPVHVYLRAGSYTVSLFARNNMSSNMKRVKSFISVNNAPNMVTSPVLGGNKPPIPSAGSLQVPNALLPGRVINPPNLPI